MRLVRSARALLAVLAAAAAAAAAPAAANDYDRNPVFEAADEAAALASLDAFRGRSDLPWRHTFQEADSLCDLGDEAITAIVFQQQAAQVVARGAEIPDAKLLSGACRNGEIVGPFEVLVRRDAAPSEAPLVEAVTLLSGTMEGGALSGLLQSSGSRYESENWGATPTHFVFGHATLAAGPRTGVFIVQEFIPVAEGGFARKTVIRRMSGEPGRFDERHYLGDRLTIVGSYLNGVLEGDVQFLADPSGPKTVCMSGGARVKDEPC